MLSRPHHSGGVYVSALELFSIGVGPSSSHTVGPMRAAQEFRHLLERQGILSAAVTVQSRLHGSLAATGLGHGTPDAVLAGLRGADPASVDPAEVHGWWQRLVQGETLPFGRGHLDANSITFEPHNRDFGHPNAMTLTALGSDGEPLASETYLSVGGGFIRRVGAPETGASHRVPLSTYTSTAELMESLRGRSLAEIAWEDEVHFHGAEAARAGLDQIWTVMSECLSRGLEARGTLPGGLRVPRRAAGAYEQLVRSGRTHLVEEVLPIYALAISEENAGGGRVVTAPTNGAAGVIPAVLAYTNDHEPLSSQSLRLFLLTATVIGSLIKANASISGAEAGCQAEVGSACAMAAAGLTAVRGGTPAQVENAAEIAIEHHLGLTCDPVGGLVQIPCIERNAVAASTALTASRLALLGDGTHIVGLDTAIETMRQTGLDMSHHYKETSTAGLAVNVVEC
ncbi:L-serine ammonia-lyase [Scrofimicrobium sp. R131]|uniref:L-serine dehydratase n=1 Tax=Scrofimicrobium appendicitidis TaxID=3079930 RepID=A0AAU7V6L9_9ACTO